MFEATDESTFLLGIEKSSIPKGWKQATVEDNKQKYCKIFEAFVKE